MKKNFPRILVCPLDWGMGHATRCVPLISMLQENGAEVIIGADGLASDFLRQYFPELEYIRYPGPRVRYPSSGSMILKLLAQAPAILKGIHAEQELLQQIIRDFHIDAVISDNRFGVWSKEIPSIYITHQVRIKAPRGWGFAEPLLSRIHSQFWENCGECWIPDYPDEPNLSGELGHPEKLSVKCHFIGPLSRFSSFEKENYEANVNDGPDLLVLLSGPEPQRSILEQILLEQMARFPERKAILLRGLPGFRETTSPLPNITMHSHLPDHEIARLIISAKVIVCRPGYSTLMDLAILGKSAVLVPTPGQTEQEYLAQHHSRGNSFYGVRQSEFRLDMALDAAAKLMPPTPCPNANDLLEKRISSLIKIIQDKE